MFKKVFVLSVGLVLVLGFVGSDLQANDKTVLVVRVELDFNSFDSALADMQGGMPASLGIGRAFYVGGRICKNKEGDCNPGGNFHCWGWDTNPFGVVVDPDEEVPSPSTSLVSQIFEIDGRDDDDSSDDSSGDSSDDSSDDDSGGSIMVSGVEAFGDAFVNRAVTGGTGRFKNATGEMTDARFDMDGRLVVTFVLGGVD